MPSSPARKTRTDVGGAQNVSPTKSTMNNDGDMNNNGPQTPFTNRNTTLNTTGKKSGAGGGPDESPNKNLDLNEGDGCLAVQMWYKDEVGEMKSEVMFCNPIEANTPKLIIPLEVLFFFKH